MRDVLLEINDLSISFGGIRAVDGVSFQLHKGEILGLIGPNGSGKSTCINLIAGNYKANSGAIIFNGKEISPQCKVHERALMGICRTFQTPKPFGHLSVYENIFAIALLKNSFEAAKKKTEEVLQLTKLEDLSKIKSEKLPIEKRKWVDFARALATDPQLIMMDECLGGLTSAEMEESLALVKEINQRTGISILFVEHIIKAVVSLCERVIVLNSGKLLAEGMPLEVLNRPEVIKAYIGEEASEE